jgi:hypothetical protein
MRRTPGVLLTVCVLGGVLAGCGTDDPPGTISEDDLPSGVEVKRVTHDDQAGQVTCQDVNDAEDNYVMTPSENYDRDLRATVTYLFKGPHVQQLSDSAWRLRDPEAALAKVAAGLDSCVESQPDSYRRFEVKGYPDAVAYTEFEGVPRVFTTRRILVPVDDRIVIVTSRRQGGKAFRVLPEDMLKKAVDASAEAKTDES